MSDTEITFESLSRLDEIGFVGTQESLSKGRKKALDRHVRKFLRQDKERQEREMKQKQETGLSTSH